MADIDMNKLVQDTAEAAKSKSAEDKQKKQAHMSLEEQREEKARIAREKARMANDTGETPEEIEEEPEEQETVSTSQADSDSTETEEKDAEQATPNEGETEEGDQQEQKIADAATEQPDTSGDESEVTYDSVREKYGLTHGHIIAAKRYEIEPEDIADLKEPQKQLDKLKAALDNISAEYGSLKQQQKPQENEPQQQEPAMRQQPQEQEQQEQQTDSQKVGDLQQKIDSLRNREDVPQEVVDVLEAQQEELRGYNQVSQQQRQAQMKDAQKRGLQIVDEWKQQYADVLGGESVFDMDRNSEDYKRLANIITHAETVIGKKQQKGEEVTGQDIQNALDLAYVHYEPESAITRKASEVAKKMKKQGNKAIGSGSRSTSAAPQGSKEKAANAVNKQMKEMNLI